VRRNLKKILLSCAGLLSLAALVKGQGSGAPPGHELDGKRLFEDATFSGNGRTCDTCHSQATGTISPEDAQKIFKHNPNDILFSHDGSDDGLGGGSTRIRKDATVLVTIPLPANVSIAGSNARSVVLRRGIPTTQNTPALDPVLMMDGRQPSLEAQAAGAIHDHAQAASPSAADLHAIAEFEKTNGFYSSPEVRRFALGGPAPELPLGHTASEKRGRRFFEDVPPNPADGFKPGLCAHCHSGPLLNQTNEFAKDFIGLPIPKGQRFISINISEFNDMGNPVQEFVFDKGTPFEFHVVSPDPGRSLITGVSGAASLFTTGDPTTLLLNLNAFKISQLRGVRNTAPYFHDNSAKTLEAVAAHYAKFFNVVTGGGIVLTAQDQQDLVAFMKLLD
jgi:cytochrome c peroxidase